MIGTFWPYALVALKIGALTVAAVVAIVTVGTLLGIAWHACTRGPSEGEGEDGMEVPLRPRFRRDSWYGRLYLTAYGNDRGWIVFLRRVTLMTRFSPPPKPAELRLPDTEDNRNLPEHIAARVDWRRRREEAYERCLVFHRLPLYQQPFFPNAPRSNLCPTFWKVMFACYVYVLGVALRRAVISGLVAAWHMLADPVLAGFRYVFRRFGRRIGYAFACAAYLAATSAAIYGAWQASQYLAERDMTGPVLTPALKASLDRQNQEARQKFEKNLAQQCEEYVRDRGYSGYTNCSRYTAKTHEENFLECAREKRFPYRRNLARVEGKAYFWCVESNDVELLLALFPVEEEYRALFNRIAAKLRVVFAKELAEEDEEYEERLAAARKLDAEALIDARTRLERHSDPRSLFDAFQLWCFEAGSGEWGATHWYGTPQGMTNATCASLAKIFEAQIDTAKSAIRSEQRQAAWMRFKEERILALAQVKEKAPSAANWLALRAGWILLFAAGVVCIVGLGFLLLKLLDRIFEQIVNGILYSVAIITAPVWGPLYLLILGVGLLWKTRFVVRVRTAVLIFARAVRQVWRDTLRFLRAFASAKWQRMCPYVDWE